MAMVKGESPRTPIQIEEMATEKMSRDTEAEVVQTRDLLWSSKTGRTLRHTPHMIEGSPTTRPPKIIIEGVMHHMAEGTTEGGSTKRTDGIPAGTRSKAVETETETETEAGMGILTEDLKKAKKWLPAMATADTLVATGTMRILTLMAIEIETLIINTVITIIMKVGRTIRGVEMTTNAMVITLAMEVGLRIHRHRHHHKATDLLPLLPRLQMVEVVM